MKSYILNIVKVILVLCATIILASCGGGGNNNEPASISISPTSVSMQVGGTATLTARASVTYDKIIWYSENPNIVQISSTSGDEIEITALKNGMTYVAAHTSNDPSIKARIPVMVGNTGPIQYVLVLNGSTSTSTAESAGTIPYPPTVYGNVMSGARSLDTVPPYTQKIVERDGQKLYQIDPAKYLPKITSQMKSQILAATPTSMSSKAVGGTQSFTIRRMDNTGGTLRITAKHLYEGQYCDIYVEMNGSTTLIDGIQAESVAKAFDERIRDYMVDNFGPYKGNANNKITILVEDIRDEKYNNSSVSQFTAGYFTAADILPYNPSNESSSGNGSWMIHIDVNPLMGTNGNYEVSKAFPTVAHEFQHLINYYDTSSNFSADNDVWWNEAFSMAAEYMLYGEDRISDYNSNDGGVLTSGAILAYKSYSDNFNSLAANYGMPFLFGQYLRTQTNTPTIFKNILSSPYTDHRAVMDGLQKLGYNDALNFTELNKNFRIALIKKESSGPYGFRGESLFNAIFPIMNTDYTLSLKGTAGVVRRSTEMYDRPVDAGANIQFYFF